MSIQHARGVADAVLYEGYLLYPYHSASGKNQSRWQFGVLGPPGAADAGLGEDSTLATQCLVRPFESAAGSADAVLTLHLRFLQLQRRSAQQRGETGELKEVAELVAGGKHWSSWDEAVEQELEFGPWPLSTLTAGHEEQVVVPAGEDAEAVADEAGRTVGRLVRTRRSLRARLTVRAEPAGTGLVRLSARVENTGATPTDKQSAIAASFIGAHLLLVVDSGEFESMTDPSPGAAAAVADCEQHRCWPVLAGPEGDSSVLLVSPIILYDHPELAEQSAGALFDSTEIDEILTLRVMTLTDEEKSAARATDPRAAEIIDRCDAMSPDELQRLHGVLRDPHALDDLLAPDSPEAGLLASGGLPTEPFRPDPLQPDPLPPQPPSPDPLMPEPLSPEPLSPDPLAPEPHEPPVDPDGVNLTRSYGFGDEVPWWDPAVDGSVAPETDEVLIHGVRVAGGSMVRVHPSRRADAQDLFFAGQVARVTAVHSDVDGETHVAVVLVDDPAAELHDWYGRYLYFAPDELEPLPGPPGEAELSEPSFVNRKGNRP